jgi:hypothetical protein
MPEKVQRMLPYQCSLLLSIVNLINLTMRVLHPPSYSLSMHRQRDVDPALLNDILVS